MTPDPIVDALLAVVGGILAAIIAGAATLGALWARQAARWHVREESIEAQKTRMWYYNRALIDHIYRGLGPPPPDPPDHLFD